MSDEIRNKWDNIYQQSETSQGVAIEALQENLHLLPNKGQGLEIACGLGANALLLSQHGLDTQAWDISSIAIEKLTKIAQQQGLPLHCMTRDVLQQPPPADTFDAIVVSYFLDRQLVPHLIDALRPNGLLFYQTFIRTRVSDAGPTNPDYRLADNELLNLFSVLRVLAYREEGRVGDIEQGFRDEASLVAQKIN